MNISLKPVTAFLKKYTALLPSICIVLASLVLFGLIILISGPLKKSMASSVSLANQVRSELGSVPSKDKPQQAKFYMDKLEEEANQIETLALQSCRRDLITYENVIFPKPVDSSAQVFHEFGQKYRSAVGQMFTDIKAMDAPSDAEIRAKTGKPMQMGGYGPRGIGGYGARTAAAQDPIIDALCLSRAKEISVYGHPSAFAWYAFWEKYEFAGESQALEDCWDSQTAFWIYQDVIDTIQKMNGGNSSVDASAVKRLLGVSFSGPVMTGSGKDTFMEDFGRMSNSPAANRDIPNYVTATLPSYFLASSPTGRISNEELDIVHFAVSVIVDNRFVLAFIKELCSEKPHRYRTDFLETGEVVENARHNQITVLQNTMKVVNPQAPEHELYRYGKGAAIQLDLVCEYQFYRKSYDSIKPEPIQKRLGVTVDSSSPAAAPGAAAPAGVPGRELGL